MRYKKIFLTNFFFLLSILLILPICVSAVDFSPRYYWGYQKINLVDETIKVIDKNVYIEIRGEILIDESLFNISDWITFAFYPKVNEYDIIENFTYSISLMTTGPIGINLYIPPERVNYSLVIEKNGYYIFNVSLKSLKGFNTIAFSTNYNITNRIKKIREFEYKLYYFSRIETNNHYSTFLIPIKYNIKDITIEGEKQYGDIYTKFTPLKEELNKPTYLYLEDLDEKKHAERIDSIIKRIMDFILIFIGVILSLFITIVYEKFKKKNELFGNIEIKKFKDYKRAIIKIFYKK